MFLQIIKTDHKTYRTVFEHKKTTTDNLLTFDVHIQLGDKKSWKKFKALLDVDSYVSLCLTESQAYDLLLLPPQESEKMYCYGERRCLWYEYLELDTYLKAEHPVEISVEVFLPEKQEAKKKFSSYCSVVHVMYNDGPKNLDYQLGNDEIWIGRQFLDQVGIELEDKGLRDYSLAFNIPLGQELPAWTPNE